MASVEDQKVLKGLTTIHFKSGRTVEGDLSEFAFAQGPEGLSNLFENKKQVEKMFGRRDVMLINVQEVEIIELKGVKWMLP